MFKKLIASIILFAASALAFGQAGTSPYPSVYVAQGGLNNTELYMCGSVQGTPLFCPTTANVMLLGTAIASAATVAPVAGITHITGVAAINTITPPLLFTTGQITLIPDGLWSTTTAGNIFLGTTAVVGKALILTYDNVLAKWYPSY